LRIIYWSFRRIVVHWLSWCLRKMELLRPNRLSIVHLVLNTSTSPIVYHILTRSWRPLIINIKLIRPRWSLVHHKCTTGLRLGIAVRILLIISIRILLLLNNRTTSTVINIKLAGLNGVNAYLEVLLADGLFVVESEIIWASSLVDHEVAGASRAIIYHELATCAGSIVNGKLIRATTSVVYHKLTTGSGTVVDGELIWTTGSIISNKFTSTRQFLLIFFSTHLYKLRLFQIPFILILINKIILCNLWLSC